MTEKTKSVLNTISVVFSLLAIAISLLTLMAHARASSIYPPIGYLASELWPDKTKPLPKGVVYNGRPFFFYVVRARELPNGEYDVRIKAR